jgi:hypothetical protein
MKKIAILLFTIFSTAMSAQNSMIIEAEGKVSPVTRKIVTKQTEAAQTKDTVLPAPAFTYTLQNKRYMTTVKMDTIKAAKMGTEPVQKLYRTYARMGLGNYSTVLGEFSVGSLRSKTGAYGLHIRHFSAGTGPKDVQGAFAGFSQQDANIFGKRSLKKHTLYGGFDYDRDVVYNYGSLANANSLNKNAIRQQYNYFGLNTALHSHLNDSDAIHHDIGMRYYHLYDRTKTKEDNFLIDIALGRYIRQQRVDLFTSLDFNRNVGTTDSINNVLLRFQPMFTVQETKWNASIGPEIVMDVAEAQTLTTVYLHGSFSFDVIHHFIVPYFTFGGGVDRNSFRSLSLANPFLMPSEAFVLKNTRRKYEISAGIRGSLSSELAYDLRGTKSEIINAPFFVNTVFSQDPFQNKFTVVYDDVDLLHLHGQISWQHFEKYRILATGDFYQYQMTNEAQAWHTPTLRLSLTGEYNLQDKIIANMQVYYLNGQYARTFDGISYGSTTLKGLVDVNVGIEYRYTKFLSAFVNFNNIASQRYHRWYGYPTQKFNLLAGLTYTF